MILLEMESLRELTIEFDRLTLIENIPYIREALSPLRGVEKFQIRLLRPWMAKRVANKRQLKAVEELEQESRECFLK